MRNKELIALLQEQDPEAEVMIRTSDGEYEYDPVDVTWDEEIECVIIQGGVDMAKEYTIGETFRQGKVNLKVCEGYCIDCYFFNRPKGECLNMACLNIQREDNQDVIFLEVKEE